MGTRRELTASLTAAARGYSLEDVSAGLPAPEPVRGQLELPLVIKHSNGEKKKK